AYSPNGPLNNYKVLDIWLEFKFARGLKIRGGHFRSPFLYEFFLLGEEKLITPERSVYNNSVITERQTGVMIYGDLLDDHLYYAMGGFTGPSHLFTSPDGLQDFIGLVDAKPFLSTDGSPFQYLHLIYSLDLGNENQSPVSAATYRVQSELDQTNYRAQP